MQYPPTGKQKKYFPIQNAFFQQHGSWSSFKLSVREKHYFVGNSMILDSITLLFSLRKWLGRTQPM
jgi:hypothetical protein